MIKVGPVICMGRLVILLRTSSLLTGLACWALAALLPMHYGTSLRTRLCSPNELLLWILNFHIERLDLNFNEGLNTIHRCSKRHFDGVIAGLPLCLSEGWLCSDCSALLIEDHDH